MLGLLGEMELLSVPRSAAVLQAGIHACDLAGEWERALKILHELRAVAGAGSQGGEVLPECFSVLNRYIICLDINTSAVAVKTLIEYCCGDLQRRLKCALCPGGVL